MGEPKAPPAGAPAELDLPAPEPSQPLAAARPAAIPLSKPAPPKLPEPALGWRVEGEWVVGQTAGGNPEHESWVTNEQYQLLPSADGESEFKIVLRQHVPYAREAGLGLGRGSGLVAYCVDHGPRQSCRGVRAAAAARAQTRTRPYAFLFAAR